MKSMLIGLIGKAYAGKDSVADHLVANHKFAKRSLAAPLKEIVKNVFRLTEEQVYGKEKGIVDPRYSKSPRDLLQQVGTECFRKLYPNVWVDYLTEEYKRLSTIEDLGLLNFAKIVVSDVRFLNEAEGIKKVDGVLWKLICPDHPSNMKMTEEQRNHPSETEQDSIPSEWISETFTVNYGNLPKLYHFADDALKCLEMD
jgi:hypothetical protein